MKFRTELQIPESDWKLDPFDGMLFMGSCFSDHMGGRMHQLGLPLLSNPFGVIFHPIPLTELLKKAAEAHERYAAEELFHYEERFYSLKHHGTYSDKNATELETRLNSILTDLRKALSKSRMLCLTFGTAWGYHHTEAGVVANCHKLPNHFFNKKLTSVEEMKAGLLEMIEALQRSFPNLKIILTVSPVRHIKDGLIENNRSKAHLLTAVHEVAEVAKETFYFPAYELVMDDLRDYRFFQPDLIHPNEMAIDYVQHKFENWIFNETGRTVLKELKAFMQLQSHRVLTAEQDKIDAHEKLISEKKASILSKYPGLTF